MNFSKWNFPSEIFWVKFSKWNFPSEIFQVKFSEWTFFDLKKVCDIEIVIVVIVTVVIVTVVIVTVVIMTVVIVTVVIVTVVRDYQNYQPDWHDQSDKVHNKSTSPF